MTVHGQSLQDWRDHLKSLSKDPGVAQYETARGVYVRTLAKVCPICTDIFWAYQRQGHERQPYQADPLPRDGKGQRETCGHPLCLEAEQQMQFEAHIRALSQRSEVALPQCDPAKQGYLL